MSPVSLRTSDSTYVLATGKAKLWMLLVGVNQYQDEQLPALQYSAVDCQGLSEALTAAAREFPHKQVMMHHDFAAQTPTTLTLRTSLAQIILAAKPQDTVLFYFSGHGVIDTDSQQAYLCLSDTQKSALGETALAVPELLEMLGSCATRSQVVWLDACHSGSLTLRGSKGEGTSRDDSFLNDPSSKLVQVLRTRAAKSKGFYALVSCDIGQRSWEFLELGHGLFTYYLMRGLRGEAADMQGVIEADGLYKYVYHQTLQYIDKTNQQLRLLNQQKQLRGETPLYPEYPPQTPKRIVEGVGELVLGLKPDSVIFHPPQELLSAELSASKSSDSATEVGPLTAAGTEERESLTAASGEVTIASTQPSLDLNNHGQVLRLFLQKDRHQFGRDRHWSDLDIPEKGWEVLSRHQAVLRKQGDDYYIYDGDEYKPSRNGIFLNHTRINIKGYLLKHGVTLEIGQDPRNQILLNYFNPTRSQLVLPSKRRLILKDLKDWPVILGRELLLERYSSMQLDSPIVSRRHATIHRAVQAGVYRLENHSTNGTFVNGKSVERSVELRDKDRIQIGSFTLIYRGEVLELFDLGSSIRLDVHNLRRQVKDKKLGETLILNDVSFAIEPGQLIAVVGGSDTGKSTLMKTLLGIEPTTSGTVFLNGDDLRQNFNIYRSQIGYVPQDDIVHQELRVEEVLTYACKLRLPPDTDVAVVVKHTLEQIMLSHVRNSFVRDLSCGQRKAVSIGVELLAAPKLIFLDQPTLGLDPGQDKEIMKLLRKLADQGRTVVLVTQATSIEECDRIAFMGQGGQLCYFGPLKAALIFFEMPSEDLKYFADIYQKLNQGTTKKDIHKTVDCWTEKFLGSSDYQSYIQASLSTGKPSLSKTVAQRVDVSQRAQLLLLTQRHLQLLLRDRINLTLSLLTGPLSIGLIILTMQGRTPLAIDSSNADLALRVLFSFSCIAIWVGLSSSVPEIVKESAIYARDRLINLGLISYVGSKFFCCSVLGIVQTLLIVSVILLGFESPESNLILWPIGLVITTFLTLITGNCLGLMISAFVPNKNVASSTLPVVMLLQIIFSGVLFELQGISSKLSWLIPSRWSVGAYGALVDVNVMPWQINLNWGMLCLHAVIYLIITLYLQKRKDAF